MEAVSLTDPSSLEADESPVDPRVLRGENFRHDWKVRCPSGIVITGLGARILVDKHAR